MCILGKMPCFTFFYLKKKKENDTSLIQCKKKKKKAVKTIRMCHLFDIVVCNCITL